jgi:hypothetical protein
MTTDDLMGRLARRGLEVIVRPDGSTCLRGDRSQATPRLLRVIRHHRAEILRRAGWEPSRRVVLLGDGPDARPERVLTETGPGGEFAALATQSAIHPGRLLAAEHLKRDAGGTRWHRFLWKEVRP